MNDPLAGDSPYADEYEDWDLWCYQYAVDSRDEEQCARVENWQDEGWFILTTGVDGDGHLVPYRQYLREECESSVGNYDYAEDGGCAVSITGIGPLDEQLRRELLAIVCEARAPYLMAVPDWLAAAPPVSCLHLPDGNLAVQGEPGSGGDRPISTLMLWQEPDEPEASWYLYSPEGEILGSTEPGGAWWMLTFPDYEDQLNFTHTPGIEYYCYSGEIHAFDREADSYEGRFWYDGTDLDELNVQPITTQRPIDPRAFKILSGAELPLLHAAQQQTPPQVPKQFAQVLANWEKLDPARPIARGYALGGYAYLQVHPLDAPDNPYRDDYGEWDRVAYARHAELCAEHDWNNLHSEDRQRVAADCRLKYLGNQSDPDRPGLYSYPTATCTDDNGFMLPYVLMEELRLHLQGQLVRPEIQAIAAACDGDYYFEMDVPLEPELQSARDAALARMQAPYCEPVPAWLADNPPHSAMFLLDGRIVTNGELGSLTGEGVSACYCCFDAAGKEVCRSAEDDRQWFEMFFTDYDEVCARYGFDDYPAASDWRGTVFFVNYESDEPAAHYTFDGQPTTEYDLAPSKPLLFEWIPGDQLGLIHEAQQAQAE